MTANDSEHGKGCIALIGLRGCGKSTVGRKLAELLDGDCIDTDDFIVQQAGRSISTIFQEEGEAGFRRRERDAVAHVAANKPAVISVGGGAVLDEENIRVLKKAAVLVWLTAPADVLWRRIASDQATADSRPPLTDLEGPEELEHLLTERSPIYEQAADVVIDTQQSTPLEVVLEIAARFKRDAR